MQFVLLLVQYEEGVTLVAQILHVGKKKCLLFVHELKLKIFKLLIL